MKLISLLLLPLGLLTVVLTACGKKTTAAKTKTAEQLAADQRAFEVRAAADQLVLEQRQGDPPKDTAAKAATAKETATGPPLPQE